jgi:hypothetical protein
MLPTSAHHGPQRLHHTPSHCASQHTGPLVTCDGCLCAAPSRPSSSTLFKSLSCPKTSLPRHAPMLQPCSRTSGHAGDPIQQKRWEADQPHEVHPMNDQPPRVKPTIKSTGYKPGTCHRYKKGCTYRGHRALCTCSQCSEQVASTTPAQVTSVHQSHIFAAPTHYRTLLLQSGKTTLHIQQRA